MSLRLGANLTHQGAGPLAEAAEAFGYEVALIPEGYRSDAPSILGLVAGRTSRIGLASAVMQIPARTPALAALTAATLDSISNGRFRLGLGVSNPDVSEGWYGVKFDHPIARTREYVDVVRQAIAGGPVTYRGDHVRLPSGRRDGAPLELRTDHPRPDLPIYLAAVGSGNLRLAGEIADGWIGVFCSPERVRKSVAEIVTGRSRQNREVADFEVLVSLPTAIAPSVRAAADIVRAQYVYLLGIGEEEHNVYCAMARDLGFGAEIERFRAKLSAGDRAAAAAEIPLEFIDLTALIGPIPRLSHRMREYAEAGVTTLGIMVSAADTTLDGRIEILRGAAAALRSAAID
ncbi:LLM class flavin-dependent oxidoreductase [Nocardia sp. NBC_01388]|uniref:LLM class flavin-dependent oxidoreductase n=1 Tax=Nocardia sp. NBC_01388 TaxID=2903596 RepID=UPI0032548AC1